MNSDSAQAIPAPSPAPGHYASRAYAWVTTVDHKRIGILYMATAAAFLVIGGIEALLMRIQLAVPNNTFLSPEAYNQIFTMHGTTMIFLTVMPVLFGFANYVVPLMIGARDMAFPRLNAMSYWLLLFGGLLLYFSFLAGGAPNAGWFSYTPLSETPFSSTLGLDYWVLALLLTGTSSIATNINLIVTILTLRAPGMTLHKLPLFAWMIFVNAFLVILALPVLNADLVMLFIDRQLSAAFFLPKGGGSPVLYQHFFWTFGHPEVYIMALPAFGMISEVVPVFSRKPIFGYSAVAASSVAIAAYSYLVWAHHMFAVGLGRASDLFFAATSMVIAIPTGIKIFNWSVTMWGGSLRLTTAMLYAVAFLIQFTIGGLTGIHFAMVSIDWQTTDTYYVVAHFHYVLFGGTFFAVLAAVYYWFPKMSGRLLSERLGRLSFWLAVIGFNTTFFVQHFLGLMGMARRVYTYPDLPYWGALNMISTVGAFILGIAVLVVVWDVIWSGRHGKPAGDNPWRAWTLEWATTSPPPEHNFELVPPVRSRRPLWDLAHPENPDTPIGAPAQPVRASRWDKNELSMACFILSEGVFFGALIIAFIYFNIGPKQGPTAASTLDRLTSGIYTICLISSSFTLWIGERHLRAGRHALFRFWLIATIVLGLVFIVGQGREYLRLFQRGVQINTNLFATSFFTLTGFHGLHVCVGLLALLIVLGLALAGDFKTGRAESLITVGLYWHFVDVVWIFVFTTVYLVGPSLSSL